MTVFISFTFHEDPEPEPEGVAASRRTIFPHSILFVPKNICIYNTSILKREKLTLTTITFPLTIYNIYIYIYIITDET